MTPALAARLLASLVVLPLLYRALGEPGQGWGGGRGAVLRRLLFAAVGTVLFFTLTGRWVPGAESATAGRGFQAYATAAYTYRVSFAPVTAVGGVSREEAVAGLSDAVRLSPESVLFRRHLGIALAERGRVEEARAVLDAAMRRLAERAPERARREGRLWDELYGPERPGARGLAAAADEVAALRLGWFGDVALLAAHARAEGPPPAWVRERVERGAARYFPPVILGALFPLCFIPQLGLISLAAAAVLMRSGVLRAAPRAHSAVGAPLWESFLLMLAMGMAPVLWIFPGGRPVPETQPGAVAALLLLRDALQVLAVGYLWWRLRARGLTLAEIGLSRRSLGANVVVGLMAAVVLMPASYLVALLTRFLSERFFPNMAPPYHPFEGLTAASGSLEVRVALFLAAAVAAPLLEEIFFRGALFGALRRRWGFWSAILLSSAIFAVLHPQLPLGFLPIALLGAGFAALYEWRQSLVPGIVAHAVNNGVVFFVLSAMFPLRG